MILTDRIHARTYARGESRRLLADNPVCPYSKREPLGRFTQAGSGHEIYLSDPYVFVAPVNGVRDR